MICKLFPESSYVKFNGFASHLSGILLEDGVDTLPYLVLTSVCICFRLVWSRCGWQDRYMVGEWSWSSHHGDITTLNTNVSKYLSLVLSFTICLFAWHCIYQYPLTHSLHCSIKVYFMSYLDSCRLSWVAQLRRDQSWKLNPTQVLTFDTNWSACFLFLISFSI